MNRPSLRQVRDAAGIAVGSILLLHEALIAPEADLNVLLAGLACLAGTFALRQDERK